MEDVARVDGEVIHAGGGALLVLVDDPEPTVGAEGSAAEVVAEAVDAVDVATEGVRRAVDGVETSRGESLVDGLAERLRGIDGAGRGEAVRRAEEAVGVDDERGRRSGSGQWGKHGEERQEGAHRAATSTGALEPMLRSLKEA